MVDQHYQHSHDEKQGVSGASHTPHLSVPHERKNTSTPTKRSSVKKRKSQTPARTKGENARKINPSIRASAFKEAERSATPACADTKKPSKQSSQRHSRKPPEKRSLHERFKSSSLWSQVLIIVFSVLFVALFIATGILCWNQWLRFDDHKDFQGTWQMEGITASFVITDSEIQLTSDVAYSYELDTFNKTISFSFGNLEGGGSYAFSPERTELIITEGDSQHEESAIPSKLIKLANSDGSPVVRESESSN